MEVPSVSHEAVHKATGKSWEEWFDYLNKIDAHMLPHKEIAEMLHQKDEVSGWWAQSITVEYERRIGRREVGQSCEGDFQASASKTLHGTMDSIFRALKEFLKDTKQFNQIPFVGVPQTSETERWRYWRVNLKEGSRITILINQKSPDKVQLAVNHEKLPDAKAVESWKGYWRVQLKEFSTTLPGPVIK